MFPLQRVLSLRCMRHKRSDIESCLKDSLLKMLLLNQRLLPHDLVKYTCKIVAYTYKFCQIAYAYIQVHVYMYIYNIYIYICIYIYRYVYVYIVYIYIYHMYTYICADLYTNKQTNKLRKSTVAEVTTNYPKVFVQLPLQLKAHLNCKVSSHLFSPKSSGTILSQTKFGTCLGEKCAMYFHTPP